MELRLRGRIQFLQHDELPQSLRIGASQSIAWPAYPTKYWRGGLVAGGRQSWLQCCGLLVLCWQTPTRWTIRSSADGRHTMWTIRLPAAGRHTLPNIEILARRVGSGQATIVAGRSAAVCCCCVGCLYLKYFYVC
jgi:hypothetical protein